MMAGKPATSALPVFCPTLQRPVQLKRLMNQINVHFVYADTPAVNNSASCWIWRLEQTDVHTYLAYAVTRAVS